MEPISNPANSENEAVSSENAGNTFQVADLTIQETASGFISTDNTESTGVTSLDEDSAQSLSVQVQDMSIASTTENRNEIPVAKSLNLPVVKIETTEKQTEPANGSSGFKVAHAPDLVVGGSDKAVKVERPTEPAVDEQLPDADRSSGFKVAHAEDMVVGGSDNAIKVENGAKADVLPDADKTKGGFKVVRSAEMVVAENENVVEVENADKVETGLEAPYEEVEGALTAEERSAKAIAGFISAVRERENPSNKELDVAVGSAEVKPLPAVIAPEYTESERSKLYLTSNEADVLAPLFEKGTEFDFTTVRSREELITRLKEEGLYARAVVGDVRRERETLPTSTEVRSTPKVEVVAKPETAGPEDRVIEVEVDKAKSVEAAASFIAGVRAVEHEDNKKLDLVVEPNGAERVVPQEPKPPVFALRATPTVRDQKVYTSRDIEAFAAIKEETGAFDAKEITSTEHLARLIEERPEYRKHFAAAYETSEAEVVATVTSHRTEIAEADKVAVERYTPRVVRVADVVEPQPEVITLTKENPEDSMASFIGNMRTHEHPENRSLDKDTVGDKRETVAPKPVNEYLESAATDRDHTNKYFTAHDIAAFTAIEKETGRKVDTRSVTSRDDLRTLVETRPEVASHFETYYGVIGDALATKVVAADAPALREVLTDAPSIRLAEAPRLRATEAPSIEIKEGNSEVLGLNTFKDPESGMRSFLSRVSEIRTEKYGDEPTIAQADKVPARPVIDLNAGGINSDRFFVHKELDALAVAKRETGLVDTREFDSRDSFASYLKDRPSVAKYVASFYETDTERVVAHIESPNLSIEVGDSRLTRVASVNEPTISGADNFFKVLRTKEDPSNRLLDGLNGAGDAISTAPVTIAYREQPTIKAAVLTAEDIDAITEIKQTPGLKIADFRSREELVEIVQSNPEIARVFAKAYSTSPDLVAKSLDINHVEKSVLPVDRNIALIDNTRIAERSVRLPDDNLELDLSKAIKESSPIILANVDSDDQVKASRGYVSGESTTKAISTFIPVRSSVLSLARNTITSATSSDSAKAVSASAVKGIDSIYIGSKSQVGFSTELSANNIAGRGAFKAIASGFAPVAARADAPRIIPNFNSYFNSDDAKSIKPVQSTLSAKQNLVNGNVKGFDYSTVRTVSDSYRAGASFSAAKASQPIKISLPAEAGLANVEAAKITTSNSDGSLTGSILEGTAKTIAKQPLISIGKTGNLSVTNISLVETATRVNEVRLPSGLNSGIAAEGIKAVNSDIRIGFTPVSKFDITTSITKIDAKASVLVFDGLVNVAKVDLTNNGKFNGMQASNAIAANVANIKVDASGNIKVELVNVSAKGDQAGSKSETSPVKAADLAIQTAKSFVNNNNNTVPTLVAAIKNGDKLPEGMTYENGYIKLVHNGQVLYFPGLKAALKFVEGLGIELQLDDDDEEWYVQTLDSEANSSRVQYIVVPGDTLETIAETRCGDARYADLLITINRAEIVYRDQSGMMVPFLYPSQIIWLPSRYERKVYRKNFFREDGTAGRPDCRKAINSNEAKIEDSKIKPEPTNTADRFLKKLHEEVSEHYAYKNENSSSSESGTLAVVVDKMRFAGGRESVGLHQYPESVGQLSHRKFHEVKEGDTILSIALSDAELGDTRFWKLIAKVNGLTTRLDAFGNPCETLVPGQHLLMPDRKEIAEFCNQEGILQSNNASIDSIGQGLDSDTVITRELTVVSYSEKCRVAVVDFSNDQSSFSINLQYKDGAQWRTITSYQSTSGRAVRTVFSKNGVTSSIVINLPCSVIKEMAMEDFDRNWKQRVSAFETGVRIDTKNNFGEPPKPMMYANG